jgi:hypothetical protein
VVLGGQLAHPIADAHHPVSDAGFSEVELQRCDRLAPLGVQMRLRHGAPVVYVWAAPARPQGLLLAAPRPPAFLADLPGNRELASIARVHLSTTVTHMHNPRYERIALACGILFAVAQIAATAFFIAALGPHLPALDAPLADQQAFYSAYRDLNALANFLFIVPVAFFLPFLAAAQAMVRRLERDFGVLTALTGTAAAALVMLWPIGIVVASAGQSMAARGLDPVAVLTFDSVAQLVLGLAGIPRAALLVGVSLAILPAGGSLRTLGVAGLVLAPVALMGVGTLLSDGLYVAAALDTLLFAIWVALLAAVLLARVPAHAPATRTPRRLAPEPVLNGR